MMTEADTQGCIVAALIAADSIAGSNHHPSNKNGIVGTAKASTIIKNRGEELLFGGGIQKTIIGFGLRIFAAT
jgi:hypothetical protein